MDFLESILNACQATKENFSKNWMVSEAQIPELRYQSDFNFEFNLKAGGELHRKIKLKLLLQYIVSPLCYLKQELE